LFIAMTARDDGRRSVDGRRACVAGALLLIFFAVFGALIFSGSA